MLRPDDPRRWIEDVVYADVPLGAKVEVGAPSDRRTTCGWPMRIVEAAYVGASGAASMRLCAFYTFLEHAVVAVVRAADRDELDRHREALVGVLETARPDWRANPMCVADFWDLDGRADERLWARRAEIQALYADGRYDEGAAAREAFRRAWAASSDPRAPFIVEYVFDRFDDVEAIEPLHRSGPLLIFRAAAASVRVEPGAGASPFVLALAANGSYTVVAAFPAMPPYETLKRDAMRLLADPGR